MEFNVYKEELNKECNESLRILENSLSRVSLGSANPSLFSPLKIMYYDSLTPIGDLCSITHPEAQQLIIKPFDKALVKDINTIIVKQNYNVTIQDEGDKLRIIFPQLTTEKRKEAVKQLSSIKEQAKIRVRNARHDVLKKMKNDEELNEDDEKKYQNEIQKIVDSFVDKIELLIKEKENELMKI